MKIEIICGLRSWRDYERDWIEEYLKRLQKYVPTNLVRVRPDGKRKTDLSSKIPPESYRVFLDPGGQAVDTAGFADLVARAERSNKKKLAFLVGSSYGLPSPHRGPHDQVISLTPLTLPHRLALLVLVEQLYRVFSWRAGSPYHHE